MSTPVLTPTAYMNGLPGSTFPASMNNSIQSPNKRPKLSLQTTSLQAGAASMSKPSTSTVAPRTIQTPTTSNTYSNTWDLSFRPSPVSKTDSPRILPPSRSQVPEQPYHINLPFGVRPILKNTPLPRPRRGSVSASPRESKRKAFFPQPKKVLFKTQLEDIIETEQYVAKHSDLSSSEEEFEGSAPTHSSDDEPVTETRLSSPPAKKRKARRDNGLSVTPAEGYTTAQAATSLKILTTPQGDRKRRKWEWTLTPRDTTDSSSSAKSVSREVDIGEANSSPKRAMDEEDAYSSIGIQSQPSPKAKDQFWARAQTPSESPGEKPEAARINVPDKT